MTVTRASWCRNSPIIWLFVQQLIRVNNRKIKYPHYWPFVRGILRFPLDSPHNGPAMRTEIPFHDVTMWTGLCIRRVRLGPSQQPRMIWRPGWNTFLGVRRKLLLLRSTKYSRSAHIYLNNYYIYITYPYLCSVTNVQYWVNMLGRKRNIRSSKKFHTTAYLFCRSEHCLISQFPKNISGQ